MSPERFKHLLGLVGPLIMKHDTRFRKAIPVAERLSLTLRYLASGDSQISLSFLFRIGRKTVSSIISETTYAIAEVLRPIYLTCPTTVEHWKTIAADSEELWQFPHSIGAIDGKHIQIEKPAKTGTLFYNYKGFTSIVLLAVCDARYNFTVADVGQYGSSNDAGVLAHSEIYHAFENNIINVPADKSLPGSAEGKLPYFLLGDDIFPLKMWLVKPYAGTSLGEEEAV